MPIVAIAVSVIAFRQRTLIIKEEDSPECESVAEHWRVTYYRMIVLIPSLLGYWSVFHNNGNDWKRLKDVIAGITVISILGSLALGAWYSKNIMTALDQGHFALCNEYLMTSASFLLLDFFVDITGLLIIVYIGASGFCVGLWCIGILAVGGIGLILRSLFPNKFKDKGSDRLISKNDEDVITAGIVIY